MASHRLFCSLEQLEEIFLFNENYPCLSKIINEFCDVSINTSEEDLLLKINKNPLLKSLFKRSDSGLKADEKKYNNLNNNEFENFLNDILILDKKDEETKKIREEYGVLAFNLNEDFITKQNYEYGFSIGSSKTSLKKCWSELFSSKPLEPINSAILIDNFLWGNISDYYKENIDNVYPILKSIIPKNLKIPFNLIIILQTKDGRLSRAKAKTIIKKMKKAIVKETGVDIEISIITQTNTKVFHKRVILTNYHYIFSDKGFVCFEGNKKIIETDGSRNWVFKDIANYVGEIDKHKHLNYSRSVHKLIDDNQKEEEKDSDTIFYQGEVLSPILSNF